MEAGLGKKSPTWRIGAWLLGATLFLSIPMWGLPFVNGFGWFFWVIVLFLMGLAFTAPYGIARLRGGGEYEAEPAPIKPSEVSAGTYVAFMIFYRAPAHVGDRIYTELWNSIGKIPHSRASEGLAVSGEDWDVIGDRSDEVRPSGDTETSEYRAEIEQHLARVAQLRAKAKEEGIDVD